MHHVRRNRPTFPAKNKRRKFAGIALLLMGWAVPAAAQDAYRVIVHKSNPTTSMSPKEVAALFLKRQTQWPAGTKVAPVDLIPSSVARRDFTREVHGKDVSAIKSYWQKLIFSGRATPPSEMRSEQDVVDFVRGRKGAIGYVSAGTALGRGVKVLQISG